MKAIEFKNKRLFYLDQTKLPTKEIWKECRSLKDGFSAIKRLEVRGAPLIGVFAGYVLYIASKSFSNYKDKFLSEFEDAIDYLKQSRPTAVNLFWALDRIKLAVKKNIDKDVDFLRSTILSTARKIHQEDINLCKKIAEFGTKLIKPADSILTHCNSGFLATSGIGTALGVICEAYKKYKNIKIYVDETRPLLQGARLTCWELKKKNIPFVLITDNMAAYLMQQKKINKVIVGADRITITGDVANKIGTYNLAVLAKYHRIDFYVAAPANTFDLNLKNKDQIPIEERDPDEVRKIFDKIYITVKDASVYNPSFDVTPSKFITAFITDRGIIYPPYKKNIKNKLRCR